MRYALWCVKKMNPRHLYLKCPSDSVLCVWIGLGGGFVPSFPYRKKDASFVRSSFLLDRPRASLPHVFTLEEEEVRDRKDGTRHAGE